MKPLIFDYSRNQRDVEFPSLHYNRKLGLNFLDGEKFINCKNDFAKTATKTSTQREGDDDDFDKLGTHLLSFISKTDVNRERDDVDLTQFYLLTKTEADRERDE